MFVIGYLENTKKYTENFAIKINETKCLMIGIKWKQSTCTICVLFRGLSELFVWQAIMLIN